MKTILEYRMWQDGEPFIIREDKDYKVTYRHSNDTLKETLNHFKQFLQACGYSIRGDIEIVEEINQRTERN